MKSYIAIYGPERQGAKDVVGILTCKVVKAPTTSNVDMVTKALENTSAGPYTNLVRIIDLQNLEHVLLEEAVGLKVAEPEVTIDTWESTL